MNLCRWIVMSEWMLEIIKQLFSTSFCDTKSVEFCDIMWHVTLVFRVRMGHILLFLSDDDPGPSHLAVLDPGRVLHNSSLHHDWRFVIGYNPESFKFIVVIPLLIKTNHYPSRCYWWWQPQQFAVWSYSEMFPWVKILITFIQWTLLQVNKK